jgi:hypothetical protein
MTRSENYKEAYEEERDLRIALQKKLKDCRNELCLRCGDYKQRHLGSCDDCRWRKDIG